MKKLTLFLLGIFSMLTFSKMEAQNTDYPWLMGFGYHGPDYTVVSDPGYFKHYFQFKDWNFTPPISKIWVGRTLGKSFTLETSLAMTGAKLQPRNDAESKSFFLDWDLGVKYKFANGYILKESCWFDPYLIAGLGVNRFQKSTHFLLTGGAGVNLWITQQFGLNIQTAYDYNVKGKPYMHHSGGVVVRLGKGKDTDGDGIPDSKDACPTEAGTAATNGCPDSDGDGIANAQDACPNAAGPASLNGCPDTDGDGIIDSKDACPSVFGLVALNGCPDSDGDGIADDKDACPNAAGPASLNGCPDRDGDGIADNKDKCPDVKGVAALNGCPDRDGDGIADADDQCPDVKGVASNHGCPALNETQKSEITQKINFAAKSIQFETGSDVIKTSSYGTLDNIVSIMREYDFTKFSIEGHTDNVGDDNKNLDLSVRRANAVFNYFVSKGISPSRLTSAGYGEQRPIADNKTAAGRAENRRVEILLKD